MYGLLLENMSDYIITKYGAERWEEIRRLASVEQPSFSVHQVYPENLIPRLSNRAIEVLGVTEKEFFEGMGVHFVGFVSQYGYDRVLSVLGRHMRDFLNGLDNLHEYLKFSYPRMRAPSFICENETRQGLTLHYRSKRRGFVYYTMGQIKEASNPPQNYFEAVTFFLKYKLLFYVARHFYRKEMGIEVVREELLVDTVHVTFQLTFDNRAFGLASLTMTREEKHLPVSASVLFEIFPFCIVFRRTFDFESCLLARKASSPLGVKPFTLFGALLMVLAVLRSSDMVVRSIGNSLMVILPDLVGNKITNWFDLVRPLVAFQFQKILNRTNNIFELVTVEPVLTGRPFDRNRSMLLSDESASDGSAEKNLRLKGQMIYMDDWRMMMYLGTPVMPDLSSLVSTGLYINDLPMHDFSRDLMLAGTQQSVELKLALDQEQHKSKKLEESMRRLDMEMRRTDELLYQMIPKAVADRLRNGENPIDTCQMFHSVSILFADVVTFTEICSRLSPMEVVSMLNGMYSIFDTLTERNRVYKVETIGDAYMVVSGAPEREDNHAEKVCDMALDMLDAIKGLKDPSTGSHLCIRVGVHSGAVVAGIVGLKMPRYCLFGDSVNTASRMESTSEAMRVHVSQPTRDLLPACYQLVERGEVQVKGKGSMKTYWLEGRTSAARALLAAQEEEEHEDLEESLDQDEDSSTKDLARDLEDDRSVYSPVTFQEIAKRSLVSSPKRQAGKGRFPNGYNLFLASLELNRIRAAVHQSPAPARPGSQAGRDPVRLDGAVLPQRQAGRGGRRLPGHGDSGGCCPGIGRPPPPVLEPAAAGAPHCRGAPQATDHVALPDSDTSGTSAAFARCSPEDRAASQSPGPRRGLAASTATTRSLEVLDIPQDGGVQQGEPCRRRALHHQHRPGRPRQRMTRSQSHHQHFHQHHHHHHGCGPSGPVTPAGAGAGLAPAPRQAAPRRSKSTGCAVT
ncbi:hypothetical protein FOCC_FOCC003785 [Frankliniella occidentalis]|nr:hypothetical protein FOCC_FOCC003785 [Frankliniella occidentalis]